MTLALFVSILALSAPEAGHAAEPMGEAAPSAGHGDDLGSAIIHHVADGRTLELPFVGEVRLPELHLGSLDLSITKHLVMLWLAAAILIVLLSITARRRERVPHGAANLVEMFVAFVRDELALKNIGEEGRRFVPYLLTTFFFILTCNLLGLVPYMSTGTSNVMVTAGLASIAFVAIQWGGIREHGFVGYLKNIVPHGVPGWLYPVMLPVEIVGMLAKPFALCVRLFANMTAGHLVILSLLGLIFSLRTVFVAPVSVGFALFINLLELLVAFIQAYIFTMLTSVFIGMTVHAH